MNYIKKTLSVIAAVAMTFCSSIVFAADSNINSAETNDETSITLSAEDINITDAPSEDVIGLSTTLNYSPEVQTYGAFQGSAYIYNTDTLTSEDAVDFYLFTLSGIKTALLSLQTTGDYIALICPYNPTTGNIDVSTSNPYVLAGESVAYTAVNNNGQNTFCLVVMNLGDEYGASYTVAMNATNPGGATSILYFSSNFSRAVCGYSNNDVYSNGVNISAAANDYINTRMNGAVFEDQYKSGSPSYIVCNVGVVSTPEYIDGDSLFYGSYTSTCPYTNLKNGLGHSSSDAIFIPINGYVFTTSLSGSYIDYQFIRDVATGFLIYDLNTNQIIDWMSSSNIFYTPNGFFNYRYSYNIYAEVHYEKAA